mgnify:CR=1 FL=1
MSPDNALGREAARVLGAPLDPNGVPVYDPNTMQVGDLPVFLAGDVTGHRPLLHEAGDEGRIAGHNAVSETPVAFERETHLLAGKPLERSVDLAVDGDRLAVDGDQQITFPHINAGPHQRRHDAARPVGHPVHGVDPPAAGSLVEGPIGSQHAHVDPLGSPPPVAG